MALMQTCKVDDRIVMGLSVQKNYTNCNAKVQKQYLVHFIGLLFNSNISMTILFVLMLYIPVNNFSVISVQFPVFLG